MGVDPEAGQESGEIGDERVIQFSLSVLVFFSCESSHGFASGASSDRASESKADRLTLYLSSSFEIR